MKNNKLIDIWFKIDTGMHRLGFNLSDAISAFSYIKKLNILGLSLKIIIKILKKIKILGLSLKIIRKY